MLKKLLSLLVFSIILASVEPSTGEAAANTTPTIKYVNITSGTLNVRISESTNASIVMKLSAGANVTVNSESNGWSEITANGKPGFVSTKYLSAKKMNINNSVSKNTYHEKAISIAKSNLGVKYRYGGTSPSGFDCSGLVRYSFAKVGKTLPRSAAEMQKEGTSVSTNSLRTGDLLFFANNKGAKPTHVSIYIGGGKMIHSASRGVSISDISSSYWKQRFIGAKRI